MNTTVHMIALDCLVAHPKNANVTPADVMLKLRRHIGRTGNYEPLVVRPHPTRPGDYELINGHHRAQVLRDLGHADAACMIWNLDDTETLLLLATINRLAGEDNPTQRLGLLEALAQETAASAEALAAWLPESLGTLEKLVGDMTPIVPAEAPALPDMEEALTLFLKSVDKKRVQKALRATHKDPARAILQWAAEHEAAEAGDGKH